MYIISSYTSSVDVLTYKNACHQTIAANVHFEEVHTQMDLPAIEAFILT